MTIKQINDKSECYDLAFNLYPTYYINKSNIRKNNSKDPSILKLTFFDTESFDVLNQDDSNYKTIKLISLNLKSSKDLNNVLNLYDKLTKLSELKYIFFKCNFKCTEVQLEELKINNSNLRIFYRIEDPS